MQFFQQVDYLRLNGHVQCRHGFVADYQFGLYRQCTRNADTLTLTAAEFVGVTVVVLRLQSALMHYVAHVVAHFFLGDDVVHAHRFGDNVADGHTGRQTAVRILEDKLNVRAVLLHLSAFEVGDVVAVEDYLTAVGIVQTKYRASERRLAATRLAHHADCRAAFEVEGHVVYGMQVSCRFSEEVCFDRKVFFEVVHLKYILCVIRVVTHV